MNINDYLIIIFLALIPIILVLFNVQEKLEKINFRKYWNGTVSKITMILVIIWILIGLIFAARGLLELAKSREIYGLILLVTSVTITYLGMEFISLGIAKLIDKFNKKKEGE